LKLLDFAIPFEGLFMEGGVFVLDEFDAAIHPELVKGIIALFNDQSINKKELSLFLPHIILFILVTKYFDVIRLYLLKRTKILLKVLFIHWLISAPLMSEMTKII